MSSLQAKAKPVLIPYLEGNWRIPNSEQRAAMAAWMAMFSMVYEYSFPETVAIPADERLWFRSNLVAPPGWLIWAGPYEALSGDQGTTFHRGFYYPKDPDQQGILGAYIGQLSAVALGGIFFLSISSKFRFIPRGLRRDLNQIAISSNLIGTTALATCGDFTARRIKSDDVSGIVERMSKAMLGSIHMQILASMSSQGNERL